APMGVGVKHCSRRECLAFMTCALLVAATWDFAIAAASSPNPLTQATSPSEADTATFTIRDFHVQGNNLLLPDRVDAILAPYIGPGRRFSDIEQARTALEQAYRQLGYPTVAVTVPEQTVEYGVITLTVYEGRLRSIDVTNA